MSSLRPLHWQVVERILLTIGFKHHRTKGSHRIYVKAGRLMHVTVPAHREIPVGTLHSIIRQTGLSREEFLSLLDRTKN